MFIIYDDYDNAAKRGEFVETLARESILDRYFVFYKNKEGDIAIKTIDEDSIIGIFSDDNMGVDTLEKSAKMSGLEVKYVTDEDTYSRVYVVELDSENKEVKKFREITVKDCVDLKNRFKEYLENLNDDVPTLLKAFMVEAKVDRTDFEELVKDQRDARAFFRVVLATMNEDYSEWGQIGD